MIHWVIVVKNDIEMWIQYTRNSRKYCEKKWSCVHNSGGKQCASVVDDVNSTPPLFCESIESLETKCSMHREALQWESFITQSLHELGQWHFIDFFVSDAFFLLLIYISSLKCWFVLCATIIEMGKLLLFCVFSLSVCDSLRTTNVYTNLIIYQQTLPANFQMEIRIFSFIPKKRA